MAYRLMGGINESLNATTDAFVLICCALIRSLPAQLANITDAPFTATISSLTLNEEATATEEIARASDGSTYSAAKTKDGRILHITLVNVPKNLRVDLHPSPPSYTYSLQPDDRKIWTSTIEQYRTSLQRVQEEFLARPNRDKANGDHHHETALGVRRGDGMTLYGQLDEITSPAGDKKTFEIWESDLGVAATNIEKQGTVTYQARILTNLQRVEPDPSLFEIPAEYIRHHPDPLLDGKKVFVDNQTGIPEVTNLAVARLNDYGAMKQHPWIVADSMDDAELVAVFAIATRTDDLDLPFELKVHAPHSEETLFACHLRRELATRGQGLLLDEKFVTTRCIGDLWTRVVNTSIGPIESVAPVLKPVP